MTSVAVRTRREIDARIERLREAHGDVPVETRTVENDPAFFDHGVDLFEAGHVGSAGAVVTAGDRVLLVRHPAGPVWTAPGGGHEPGERLAETARREVREETAVDCRVTGVARVVRKRFVDRTEPARRGYLVEAVFTAEHVAGDPDASADDEILAAAWFDRANLPAERADWLDAVV